MGDREIPDLNQAVVEELVKIHQRGHSLSENMACNLCLCREFGSGDITNRAITSPAFGGKTDGEKLNYERREIAYRLENMQTMPNNEKTASE